MLPSTIKMR